MSDPPQFDAEALAAGAVAKDGRTAVIEFVAGDERLWVTLPIGALSSLAQVCAELEALGADARNGVAHHWHVTVPHEMPLL